ncbi:MAG: alkaline phosphatase [Solirubrobacteraceae bacterium]
MRISRKAGIGLLGAAAVLAGGGIAVGAAGDDDYSATLAGKIDPSRPQNVILLVGDGMGDSEVTLARYYGKGAAGRLNMDRLPFRGSSIHYVLRPGPGPSYAPNYVGDSAPTATAWSTGKRTQDGRVSQGPSAADNVPGTNAGYRTYLEIARDRGKATGNVSTAEITDATPAGPSSHISQRACQGPADARTTCPTEIKSAGGLGSIAEQQVDEGFDLYLGGGRNRYAQTLAAGGADTVVDYAEDEGYDVIGTKAELAAIDSLDTPVIGLFNNSNLTTEYAPLFARNQAYYDANPLPGRNVQVHGGSETTRCQMQDRGTEPSLPEMTAKAIELLSADPDGFTLQVEGASIDKRDHAADLCGQIGETLAFDEAIGVALDFQRDNPDTLVIVTADHAHTSQMTYATGALPPSTSHATVQTADGAPIRVAYGTAETGTGATTSGSQSHTGAEVPVWAIGPQAANIQGTIDQTDIFGVLNGKTPSKVPGGGAPGRDGEDGQDGAPGAPGQPGRDGRDGRDGVLTCKATGRKTVTCKVGAARKGASAKLVRKGRTVARATVRKGKLVFRSATKLKAGRYRIVVGGTRGTLRIG